MRSIIISIVLVVLIDFTIQTPRIGRLCPESDKLKEEFTNMCIEIKCRNKKILLSNFTIESGKGLAGLHERFHKVNRCNYSCPSGTAPMPTNVETLALLYPLCCGPSVCVNTLGILYNLKSGN